jgi:hypothetical protein
LNRTGAPGNSGCQRIIVLPKKMSFLRFQLAIIIVLWVLAEGWFAFYWWPSQYFSQCFPSVCIPITVIAIVMIAWTLLRSYVIRLASKSIQGKAFGIALLLTASVLGGFAPLLIGQILVESDILTLSFHGDAAWSSLISSMFLWMTGALFSVICIVEILMKKIPKQLHDHGSTPPTASAEQAGASTRVSRKFEFELPSRRGWPATLAEKNQDAHLIQNRSPAFRSRHGRTG